MPLARVRIERVAPDTARVVREQMDGDGRLPGGRPHSVDVVGLYRGTQDEEVFAEADGTTSENIESDPSPAR